MIKAPKSAGRGEWGKNRKAAEKANKSNDKRNHLRYAKDHY